MSSTSPPNPGPHLTEADTNRQPFGIEWLIDVIDACNVPPENQSSDVVNRLYPLTNTLHHDAYSEPNPTVGLKDMIAECERNLPDPTKEEAARDAAEVDKILRRYRTELEMMLDTEELTEERKYFLAYAYMVIHRAIQQHFPGETWPKVALKATPPGFTKTLAPYQLDGVGRLAWLEDKFRGGFLCDEMGLGKTLQIITLMVVKPAKPTIVVVPLSILGQWVDGFEKEAPGQFKVFPYHGDRRSVMREGFSTRRITAFELADYDVVVTTYGTLAREYKELVKFTRAVDDFTEDLEVLKSPQRGNCALYNVEWGRIVLDEAHRIRNDTSEHHLATCALEGQRRIFCSGTPFQNDYDSILAAFKFIRLKPWNDPDKFRTVRDS
jgi:SNF2 family DNA or RNA helicase